MVLFNAQVMVLAFGNTYISMLMLTNLTSVEALAGKARIYISGVILVLIFSLLPVCPIKCSKGHRYGALFGAVCVEFVMLLVLGNQYSPLWGYVTLGQQHYETQKLLNELDNIAPDSQEAIDAVKLYYRKNIEGFIEKDSDLPEQPNIILIFTEGLSQHIIEDERMIMPNVAEYQKKAISFDQYYNHTFATYRGLIGQLYSGYQLNNNDSNELVSVQSILSDQGYNTFWINTEPQNEEFTAYQESFGFDEIIGGVEDVYEYTGAILDKKAYEILFDLAEEQENTEEPFFIGIYTFGTHASLGSPDEKFGDGTDEEINKFYNMDYQFGLFMEKFENSSLKDNTIVIFTTDHATYQDDSFDISFPGRERKVITIDEIPLFIYYNGVDAQVVDAEGRNTLNLAPTVLDFLDISAANYFIGTSLFSRMVGSICETTYQETSITYSTANGKVAKMEEAELNHFQGMLESYYKVKEVAASADK